MYGKPAKPVSGNMGMKGRPASPGNSATARSAVPSLPAQSNPRATAARMKVPAAPAARANTADMSLRQIDQMRADQGMAGSMPTGIINRKI